MTDDAALSRSILQGRAAKGVLWTGVHTLVSLPVAFLVNLVLARVLGAASYGRLAVLTTLMDVVGVIVGLGVGNAVVQFGAKAHGRGDRGLVRDLLSKAQGFRLIWAAPVITVAVLLVADAPLALVIAALVFGIWLPAASSGAPMCLAIEQRTDRAAQLGLVTNLVLQIAVVITVVTVATPDSVWLVRLVVGGLSAVATLLFVSADYRRAVLTPRLPRQMPRGFWRFALPTGLSTIIGTLVASRTEVFFLTELAPAAEVGVFALAYGLMVHLFAPVHTLVNPLVPAISSLREVDEGAVAGAFGRSLRVTSTISALLVSAALPSLVLLLPYLYGRDFAAGAPMLLALAVVSGLSVASEPIRIFVLARLRADSLLWVDLSGLAVAVVLMIVAIPLWGAWGAVAAKVASSLTLLVLLAILEVRHGSLSAGLLLRSLVPSLAAGLIAPGMWLLATVTHLTPVAAAAAAGITGLLAVLVSLRVLRSGLTRADADVVIQAMPIPVRPALGPLVRATAHAL